MPRGRTLSPLDLSERREFAYEKMSRGWTNRSIAQELQVTEETVARYRTDYEERFAAYASTNPQFLTSVFENTLRALEELDQIKASAWQEYEAASGRTIEFDCEVCGEANTVEIAGTSASTRNALLKTLVTVQEQRSKLFGLFGVKAEFLALVANVQTVQDRLLTFMRNELCEPDRRKLERLLTHDLAAHMQAQPPLTMIANAVQQGD